MSGPGTDPLRELRENLLAAARAQHVARWQVGVCTALLMRHPYGLHFSVGGPGRLPTDDEVDACFLAYKFGLWVEDHMQEATSAHQRLGAINPYVRHFVPDEEADRMEQMAAEL